ncbi:hypothetical protein NQZ68_041665 [Dissostichus eleginoides]|nr:hypothetical protein NQZ68_007751 [Dissostichus eleginoides]KAI9535718.1 hypothetical protein NQZ68_041665 [Dissostichus eleginoides]
MNGAGNKVGIETDPESAQEQHCLSCTVISSEVSADPRLFPLGGKKVSECQALESCACQCEQQLHHQPSKFKKHTHEYDKWENFYQKCDFIEVR